MMGLDIDAARIAAGIVAAALSVAAHAGDIATNREFPTDASFYTHDSRLLKSGTFDPPAYLLAAGEGGAIEEPMGAIPPAEFKPPLLSGRKIHQYLGVSTVALAGLTMLAAPDNECEQSCPSQPRQTSGTTHTRLARATAAMAVATVVTGLIYHWDDFHLGDGFADPDNQHVMLAGAGSLLMLYAVNKSAKSPVPTSHAGIAELGAVTMLFAVKLTW